MIGAMEECGPFRMHRDLTVSLNKYGWHSLSDMLFLDQPVMTGFSFGTRNISSSYQVAEDMLKFLDNFLAIFTEYKSKNLFITGESYAGTYIPFIAKAILDRNGKKNYNIINLKGIAMGNPWLSLYDQSMTYLEYSQMNDIVSDPFWINETKYYMEGCKKYVAQFGDSPVDQYGDCYNVLNAILNVK